MRTTVTARHCEIPDDLRARAREVMDRLRRLVKRPESGYVVFEGDGPHKHVELRLKAAANQTFTAEAKAAEFRTALDRARAKMRRQLERAQTRRVRARHGA